MRTGPRDTAPAECVRSHSLTPGPAGQGTAARPIREAAPRNVSRKCGIDLNGLVYVIIEATPGDANNT